MGMVIDGVYRPRDGVSFGDLGEVDRIEVLEGPQGTTFGENTTAGVINVMTKAPSFTSSAEGEASVRGLRREGRLPLCDGPVINDKLAGSLYIAERSRDGFYNVDTGAGPRTRHDRPGPELLDRRAASYSGSPATSSRCG